MAKQNRDWSEILIKRGVMSPDQLKEARAWATWSWKMPSIKLNYARRRRHHEGQGRRQFGMDFVALREIEDPHARSSSSFPSRSRARTS